jgi:methylated-DNA-[protein]-cysteine S-methyltransferase
MGIAAMVTHLDPETEIAYADMSSPIGTLWIAAGERGLVRVSSDEDEATFRDELGSRLGLIPVYAPEALEDVVSRFVEYFAGERTAFDLPVDLRGFTPFQRAVLEEVRNIPYGQVRSYGEIAWAVGKPRAARAVGTVMATCPISLVIPCHRVVRSDGTPGQYGSRPTNGRGLAHRMRLLSLERATLPSG